MGEIISGVSFAIMIIYFLFQFFKSKKIHNLIVVFIFLSAIFFKTPFSKNINKFIEDIWVFTILITGFLAIYLANKKENKK